MWRVLVTCAGLAAAEPAPPPAVALFETPVAMVAGVRVSEVSFVAAHCFALQRHLEFSLELPPLPPPVSRLEIADPADLPPFEVRVAAGTAIVFVRLGEPTEAPQRAATAAAQSWLARVALAGRRPLATIEPWARQALACEVIAQLRPAMNDHWYREGRRAVPSPLAEVLAGRSPDWEALLFWRALRASLGSASAAAQTLIASAHGTPVLAKLVTLGPSPDEWWLVRRAELLLSRSPVSLGVRESAESLDDIARFVFDLGAGEQLVSGAELPRHRDLPAIKASAQARLSSLRRELLRQNPIYHNAWRAYGSWLENLALGKPDVLAGLWAQYLEERRLADELGAQVESALSPPPVAK